MISWSRVKHFPPALTILALADSVNLRAAMVSLGTSRSLLSSVIEVTATTILSLKVRSTQRGHLLSFQELDDFGDRNRRSVHSGRNQSSQHGFAESGVGSSGQESEELNFENTSKRRGGLTLMRRCK